MNAELALLEKQRRRARRSTAPSPTCRRRRRVASDAKKGLKSTVRGVRDAPGKRSNVKGTFGGAPQEEEERRKVRMLCVDYVGYFKCHENRPRSPLFTPRRSSGRRLPGGGAGRGGRSSHLVVHSIRWPRGPARLDDDAQWRRLAARSLSTARAAPSFDALRVPTQIAARLARAGIVEPPCRRRCWRRHDAGGAATSRSPKKMPRATVIRWPTGSGKTLAYALPVLARLDPHARGVQAVVVVPTRELYRRR